MKKILTALVLALFVVAGIEAQTLHVVVGKVGYAFSSAQTGQMNYADGKRISIQGKEFEVGDITRMYVDNVAVDDNQVKVVYSGEEAAVMVSGNVARYVDPTVDKGHVKIVQSADVGDDTCGEITYALSGSSSDGAFELEGSYKATVELCGFSLANASGAPLSLMNGKRIALSVKKDTENMLADAATGSQKACLYCKGHLELKGKGVLTVKGYAAHGIAAKEYVEMKNCTVNVLAAQKDGVNCNQYFLIESGELNISGVGDDGVQVSFKDDTDREAEDTGTFTMKGGKLEIAVTAVAAKGIKVEGDINITDGTLTIGTSGGGVWNSDAAKVKASSCLSADGNVQIDGGTLALTSTGAGAKGIRGDGLLIVNGGNVTVNTSGGLFAYVNGTAYNNYTGNADRLTSSQKASPKGIRMEGNVEINGGNVMVTSTGNGAEGIESKKILTINDGTIVVNAYDDAINSSSHMYIKGGDVTVVSSGNDGLDSNGNMYISGGVIKAFGTSSPECGIDANEEGGYSVVFTGGSMLAVGGGNSVPSTSASTQAYVSGNVSVSAGNEITLKSGSTTLATFTVPSNYGTSSRPGMDSRFGGPGGGGPGGGGSGPGGGGGPGGGSGSVLITYAGLTSGSSYTLTSGSSSASVTAVLKGSGGRH